MKKSILLVLSMVCVLFPSYGNGAVQNPRADASKASTNMIWKGNASGPYYFDLSSAKYADNLANMINIPGSVSQEIETITKGIDTSRLEPDGVTLSDVKDKEELADAMYAAGHIPAEWHQVGFIAGLEEYLKADPNRVKNLSEEQKSFIRFVELYVLAPIYMSEHNDKDNFNKVEKIRVSLHGFVAASNGVSVLVTKETNGGENKIHQRRDKLARQQAAKQQDGGNGNGNGNKPGTGGNGHGNGTGGNGNGNGQGGGGGDGTGDDYADGIGYDGRFVYEPWLSTEDETTAFFL